MNQVTSKQAPGALQLVQAFVNSVDGKRDDLDSPEVLGRWLLERGLLARDATVGCADLASARDVREALRRLMLANNGADDDPAALATLNRLARSAQMTLTFEPNFAARLESSAPGVDGALGRLLAVVFEAMIDGSWMRLKACAEQTCRWAFFDHSRNRSGTWCSMAVCGNREKAKQYRARRRPRLSAKSAGR
jgi:predicted RNA-binding Zn ribbon-like protein